jgi:hypothetical protein
MELHLTMEKKIDNSDFKLLIKIKYGTKTLLTSIIGIIAFTTIMYFGIKYANGKWKVSESKIPDYLNWSNTHGKKLKKE